jgi:alkanesulfonate monooxygenase SsuD/methylene tetrahydromethanopterin reductase-like flavin-dependent oxidoreductase (luciferase family)
MTQARHTHIGIAFNGIDHDAGAGDAPLHEAAFWIGPAQQADSAGFDFLSFEDTFAAEPNKHRSALDATLLACRIGPLTDSIGVFACAVASYSEPFHLSTASATLDFVTLGRAGLQLRVPDARAAARAAAHAGADIFGPGLNAGVGLHRDTGDAIEAIRRLWDSWEDGAEIRDEASGRFLDREKLHYVDFTGATFSVRGPSIVPRPPQGQPVVAVAIHSPEDWALAAEGADIAFIAPADDAGARQLLHAAREAQANAARRLAPLLCYADIAVSFGAECRTGLRTDGGAPVFEGGVAALAARIAAWHALGVDGFRLHPVTPGGDVRILARELAPLLRGAGLLRQAGVPATLRARLGLAPARNRYLAGAV